MAKSTVGHIFTTYHRRLAYYAQQRLDTSRAVRKSCTPTSRAVDSGACRELAWVLGDRVWRRILWVLPVQAGRALVHTSEPWMGRIAGSPWPRDRLHSMLDVSTLLCVIAVFSLSAGCRLGCHSFRPHICSHSCVVCTFCKYLHCVDILSRFPSAFSITEPLVRVNLYKLCLGGLILVAANKDSHAVNIR